MFELQFSHVSAGVASVYDHGPLLPRTTSSSPFAFAFLYLSEMSVALFLVLDCHRWIAVGLVYDKNSSVMTLANTSLRLISRESFDRESDFEEILLLRKKTRNGDKLF